MCYHSVSKAYFFDDSLRRGVSFRQAELLLMKETEGLSKVQKEELLFFIIILFLNQTTYNSVEQWRAKNKHYSLGFVFSFYSSVFFLLFRVKYQNNI